MRTMDAVIYTEIPRSDPALIAEAAACGIADLHEALGAVGGRMLLMSPRMRPTDRSLRIAGPAVTALNYPGDNLMMHQALYLAQQGDVLVFTNGGGTQGALWGELAATQAKLKGVAGLVADGGIRDVAEIEAMGFAAWSTAISPVHPEKRGPGAVNIPLVCDGVLVNPGDIVVADADGVLVVPREHLELAVSGARKRRAKEEDIRKGLNEGKPLFELLGMQKAVEASGAIVRNSSWLQDS